MVSYDTTQIALFVSIVLIVALVGTALVLGVLAQALIRSRRTPPARPGKPPNFHGPRAIPHRSVPNPDRFQTYRD
jgi:hypothetical protein